MVIGTAAERPAKLAVSLSDQMLVDAGEAHFHRPFGIELPVLVAIGAEPLSAVIVVLVGETHAMRLPAKVQSSLISRQSVHVPICGSGTPRFRRGHA